MTSVLLSAKVLLFATWSMLGGSQISYVSECCNQNIINSSAKLMKCVNASAEQFVIDSWSLNQQRKFALISYASENIVDYAAYSFAVNQIFSELNNYLFKLADPSISKYEPLDPRWNKVKILQTALDSWASDCDYIVWLDADLIVLDVSLDLNSIVEAHSEAEMIASKDIEYYFNSGFIIFKNSKYIRDWLLPTWWSHGIRREFSDQVMFHKMVSHFTRKITDNIALLHMEALNSHPPAQLKQSRDAVVLHLMGDNTPFRKAAFRSGFEEICRVLGSPQLEADTITGLVGGDDCIINDDNQAHQVEIIKTRLKPQLGLSQPKLFALVLIANSRSFYDGIQPILQTISTQQFTLTFNGLYHTFNFLNDCILKYSVALDYIDKTWTSREKQKLKVGEWTKFDDSLYKLVSTTTDVNSIDEMKRLKTLNRSYLQSHPLFSFELRKYMFILYSQIIQILQSTDSVRETEGEYDVVEFCHLSADYTFLRQISPANRIHLSLAFVELGIPYLDMRMQAFLEKRVPTTSMGTLPTKQFTFAGFKLDDEDLGFASFSDSVRTTMIVAEQLIGYVNVCMKDMETERPDERFLQYNKYLINIYILNARFLANLNKYDEAIAVYRSALLEDNYGDFNSEKIHSQHVVSICSELANLLCMKGQFRESYKYFDKILSLFDANNSYQTDPQIASYYKSSGEARYAGGDHKTALQYLQIAANIYQRSPKRASLDDIHEVKELIALIEVNQPNLMTKEKKSPKEFSNNF